MCVLVQKIKYIGGIMKEFNNITTSLKRYGYMSKNNSRLRHGLKLICMSNYNGQVNAYVSYSATDATSTYLKDPARTSYGITVKHNNHYHDRFTGVEYKIYVDTLECRSRYYPPIDLQILSKYHENYTISMQHPNTALKYSSNY